MVIQAVIVSIYICVCGGAESEYIRTRKDERARARTEKCVER
jgi:hypothetical protein